MAFSLPTRRGTNGDNTAGSAASSLAGFGRAVGRTRYAVLVAVVAVLLVSITLFLLGAAAGVVAVVKAWDAAIRHGQFGSTDLTVEFLTVIGVMLRAVVFYIIGVGLYSLFIEPLNLTAALGIESLVDLESKVISVVVVIMAVTFLQHFIRWENPVELLQHGATLSLVTAALVLFQWNNRQSKEFAKVHAPDEQKKAASEMFHEDKEKREITSGSDAGSESA